MASSKDLVPPICINNELRMVMVGKTGVGKSRTGNTIVGENIFPSKVSACSVTSKCKQHSFERDGQNIQLIDVPGFVDTNLSEEEIKSEVVKCVGLSHPGLHAILFLIDVGRFTEVDINTIEHFCKCFGEDSMQFVIVIFTKLDSLKQEDMSLEEYLKTAPPLLRELLNKTNNRYLGVNNWSDQKAETETFFKELISMVKSLVNSNSGKCYTNEMYKLAEDFLQKGIEKERERLAKEGKKREEEKMRQAMEELQKKFERERKEMEVLYEARQMEIKQIVEEKRKQEEEKMQKAEAEIRRKLEHQQIEKEEKDRQMKDHHMEIKKLADDEKKKLEEEKRQAKEEIKRKKEEYEKRIEREMKEKTERLKIKFENERIANAFMNQRREIEESRGIFDTFFDMVGNAFSSVASGVSNAAVEAVEWFANKF